MTIAESNSPVAEGIALIISQTGVRQSFVAQKAGYTDQMLSDMLNGRKVIRACDVPRLAMALSVTTNDIYEAGLRATEMKKK